MAAFISVLYEKLTSATSETLAPYDSLNSEINKLERLLFQIRNLLTDASHKEITDQSVKQWLNHLQHLAYDIDDVLDDLATEAMDRELTDESETETDISKVQNLLNKLSMNSLWSKMMKEKINDISNKLEDLIEEKDVLGLIVKEEFRSKDVNRRLQTSMVDVSIIIGREAEKDALVHKLLRGEPCDQNFSIVPIVGAGGVGKTTLARLLYDDQQVKDHFEIKAWVSVSGEFDSFGISKVIFESVTGKIKVFVDLKLIQLGLRDHLKKKRFLLVLDDVCSESCEDWETIVGPFHACSPGSKIIMTTRKDKLLKMLGYNNLNQLQSLSHDDALSLVALHALGVNNFDSHLTLKPHAVGIVRKCDGLPLALKVLGRLLGTKKDEDEYWKQLLDSEVWMLSVEDEIVPALRLSYHDLSARLKQLFAYCSLFPKGFLFDKEELVQLWMAEGFLHQSIPSDLTKERLGYEYFDELLSRSFFQHAPNNESLFVMHDMVSDLATCIAGEFFLRLEKDFRKEALEKYRHMSFVREEYVTYKKFEAIKRAKSLKTFLATSVEVVSKHCFFFSNKILVDLFLEFPLLRVLCLSGFRISEIPESIGTLRHLRYFNVSQSFITHLPESVCNLYNLETLILCGCHSLAKFPNNFSKLKNLRHLDVRDTWYLKEMPLGIGDFKSLQTLSKIFIGGVRGFEITNLKYLKNLCGKISIQGLEKVQNVVHAREADFSQKRLGELEVVWSDVPDGSRNDMLEKEVLNELKPSNEDLKRLEIISYGGLEFPNWVGEPSFIRLNYVSIRGCKKCTSLPPLEQLPTLKELFIEGLDEVKAVQLDLLGPGVAFPSLETLSFQSMGGWVKWSTNSGVVSFPRLQKLLIGRCPNLVELSLEALPSLNVLHISECDSGVVRRLVQVASSLTKLEISYMSGLNDVVWRGVVEYLGVVEELKIWYCNEIKYLWESEAVASKFLVKLRKLEVTGCDNLLSLGEKEEADNSRRNLLTSLRMLEVSFCNNIKRCSCPHNIEMLKFGQCTSITSICIPSTGGQKLKSLDIWGCNKLMEREWGGLNMNNRSSMPMLDKLRVTGWPNLKSIINLNYLVHLTSLSISACESLESFPDNELSSLTSLTSLAISNCPRMDACFPRGIWPPNLCTLQIGKLKKPVAEWGPQNFPTSLVELYLLGDDGVSSCSQFSHILPSSLISLHVNEFENLESVSMGLQHLTSLQYLSFDDCPLLNKLSQPQHLTFLQYLSFDDCPDLIEVSHPQHLTSIRHLFFHLCENMMNLPEALLPSLLSLQISESPNLKERCRKGGCYWPLISHIPFIEFYPQLF